MKKNCRLRSLVSRVTGRISSSSGHPSSAETGEWVRRPVALEELERRILFSGSPAPAPEPGSSESGPAQEAPAPASQENAPAPAEESGENVATPPDGTESETGGDAGEGGANAVMLTQSEVAAVAEAAKERWVASGISAEQEAALESVTVEVADLGGNTLGTFENGTIIIDDDGAGFGWFIDATPNADEEFGEDGSAPSGSSAAGRLDLLSVLLHEQGHALGLGDGPRGVMQDHLYRGTRLTPGLGQAEGATPGSITTLETMGVGTIERVADIVPGAGDSDPGSFVVFNGKLYFEAEVTGANDEEPFVYDPVADTVTQITTNSHPVGDDSNVTEMFVFNGNLYANMETNGLGRELFKLNAAGTQFELFVDLNPGAADGRPNVFENGVLLGSDLYFSATDDTNGGDELYKFRASDDTIVRVADIVPGAGDSDPGSFVVFNGKLYFEAEVTGANDEEPFVYDPVADTVTQITTDSHPVGDDSNVTEMFVFNGNLYANMETNGLGRELFKLNAAGTQFELFVDLNPGAADGRPNVFENGVLLGSDLYFSATDDTNGGDELYKFRASDDTIVRVADIVPGAGDSDPGSFVVFNGKLYFEAEVTGANDEEPFVYDPVADTVTQITTDSHPVGDDSNVTEMFVFDGNLYANMETNGLGRELFKLNAAGTQFELFVDLNPGAADGRPNVFENGVLLGSDLYFSATDDTNGGDELYRFIGTPLAGPTDPTSITIDGGGNLVIDDIDTTLNNQFVLTADGTTLTIEDTSGGTIDLGTVAGTGSGTSTVTVDFTEFAGGITLNGAGGNDSLEIGYTGGTGFDSRAITFNGGDPTTGPGDILILTGGTFASAVYNYANSSDGTIQLDGQGLITYTGLEPISSTINATDVTLNFSGAAETVTVTDAGGGQTTVNSTAGEVTTFNNPTGTLTINGGGGDDTIHVDGLAANYPASLVIDTQGENDSVFFNAALTLNGDLTVTTETLRFFASVTTTGDQTYTGLIVIQAPVTWEANDVFANGAAAFSGAHALTVDVGGANSVVANIAGSGELIKEGAGTLTLSGTDTYTGATTISAGTFLLTGTHTGGSAYAVNAGGILGGTGSTASTVTVNSGGSIAPGNSPGILSTGSVTFTAGSTFTAEIGGTAGVGVSPDGHDQLVVSGVVSLGGSNLDLTFANFLAGNGDSFTIIDNDGAGDAVVGTFDGLAEGAVFFSPGGQTFQITYLGNDGNDVALTALGETGVHLNGDGDLVLEDIAGGTTTDQLTVSVVQDSLGNDALQIRGANQVLTSDVPGAERPDTNTVVVPFTAFDDLIILTNGGDDIINLDNLVGFDQSVTVDGGDGFDEINFGTNASAAAGESYSLTAEKVKFDFDSSLAVAGDGTIGIAGTGGGAEDVVGIQLKRASLSSEDGAITLEGEGGSSGNHNDGVLLTHGSSITTTGGSVSITGTATSAVGPNDGVSLVGGSDITVGGAGTITITGTSSGVNDSYGVQLFTGTELTADGGDITLVGGGTGTGARNSGIYSTGATVTTTGAGSISLDGEGSGTGSHSKGLRLTGSTLNASGGGGITLTGTGGGGTSSNVGVEVGASTSVTTASGDVTITGEGAGSTTLNAGVSFLSGSSVDSGGNITVTGTAGNGTSQNDGVSLTSATLNATGNLSVTGVGDGSASYNRGIDSTNSSLDGAGVTLTGTGTQNGGASARFGDGVYLNRGGASAVGTLTIDATGGTGSSNNRGFYASGVTLGGTLAVTGTADAGTTGSGNSGVFIQNSTLSDDGTIAGTGGGGTGPNFGVYMQGVTGGAGLDVSSGPLDDDEEKGGNYFNILPALLLAAGADQVARRRKKVLLSGLIAKLGGSRASEDEVEIYREEDGHIGLESTVVSVGALAASGVEVPEAPEGSHLLLLLTGGDLDLASGFFATVDATGEIEMSAPIHGVDEISVGVLISRLDAAGAAWYAPSPRCVVGSALGFAYPFEI